ncbi:MAG TPA: bifunctional sugar-1-phosphate nucleotidylyltransferase/acetyltransferase [Thermoplasmata archaeon]|nr:bifunctional sugar-1-phosphate nucleotidylyltransferase/acetyltransferase [Thermoplasmata archaeon]
MKAVVLAAGEGARMGPLTTSEPKVMIPVGNKPILEYAVEALVENGIHDVVLVVGYRKERIQSYFEDGRKFNARIEYAIQGKQLGSLHGLWEARSLLRGPFLAVNGSNLVDAQAVADLLEAGEGPAMVIAESENPEQYGVVSLAGHYVEKVVEKPPQPESNLVNGGLYLFDAAVFSLVEPLLEAGHYDVPSLVNALAGKTRVRAVRTKGTWLPALYPWDLLRLNAHVLGQVGDLQSGTIEKDVTLRGHVVIGDGSRIRSGTYILGPAIIGKGCEIGPNVVVYPSTSIGDNVKVQAFSAIENSILMDDVFLGPQSHVSNSVLASGVRAASNLMASADRADAQVEGEWHAVERIGALVGEDTEIRDGVVIEPGCIVGARCRIGPLTRVRGTVPNGTNVM